MSLRGVGGFTDLQEAKDFSRAVSEGDIDTISKYAEKGVISTELYNELIEEFGAVPEKKPEAPHKEEDIIALANQGKVHIHLRDDVPEKGHIPDPKDKYPRITLPREEPRQEENNPIINFFRRLFKRR